MNLTPQLVCTQPECGRPALHQTTACWQHCTDREAFRRKISAEALGGEDLSHASMAGADLGAIDLSGAMPRRGPVRERPAARSPARPVAALRGTPGGGGCGSGRLLRSGHEPRAGASRLPGRRPTPPHRAGSGPSGAGGARWGRLLRCGSHRGQPHRRARGGYPLGRGSTRGRRLLGSRSQTHVSPSGPGSAGGVSTGPGLRFRLARSSVG